MAEVKITQRQNAGDYSTETTFEAKDIDHLNEDLIKGLFVGREVGQAEQPEVKPRQAWVITEQPGVKHDVVAIYDNAGIPSIMHRFTKTTNKELFGGSEKTHPAFIIGGVEYDEIYISVYPNRSPGRISRTTTQQRRVSARERAGTCLQRQNGDCWRTPASCSERSPTETQTAESTMQTRRNTERNTTTAARPSQAAARRHGHTITHRREYTTFAVMFGK